MDTKEGSEIAPPAINPFSGEWGPYEEELYRVYESTVIKGGLSFLGLPVRSQRRPDYKEKHYTFWHLTSEGKVEDKRTPDLRRCERLHWIEWVIRSFNLGNYIRDNTKLCTLTHSLHLAFMIRMYNE